MGFQNTFENYIHSRTILIHMHNSHEMHECIDGTLPASKLICNYACGPVTIPYRLEQSGVETVNFISADIYKSGLFTLLTRELVPTKL